MDLTTNSANNNWKSMLLDLLNNDAICSVSEGAELYFLRLIRAADGFGNLPANPILLHRATVGPRKYTVNECVDYVNELLAVDLIELCKRRGSNYLHISEFSEFIECVLEENENIHQEAILRRQEAYLSSKGVKSRQQMLPNLNNIKVQRLNMTNNEVQPSLNMKNSEIQPLNMKNTITRVGVTRDRGKENTILTKKKNKILQKEKSISTSLITELRGLEKAQFAVEAFEYWRDVMGLSSRTQLSPERQRKLNQRWEDTTLEELKQAIDGCFADDFHMARGQFHGRNKYRDLKLICKDRSKVEQLINIAERKRNNSTEKRNKSQEAEKRWNSD